MPTTGPKPVSTWTLAGKPTTTYTLWKPTSTTTPLAQVWMLPVPTGYIDFAQRELQAVGMFFRYGRSVAQVPDIWEIVTKPLNDFYYKHLFHSNYWKTDFWGQHFFSGFIHQDTDNWS